MKSLIGKNIIKNTLVPLNSSQINQNDVTHFTLLIQQTQFENAVASRGILIKIILSNLFVLYNQIQALFKSLNTAQLNILNLSQNLIDCKNCSIGHHRSSVGIVPQKIVNFLVVNLEALKVNTFEFIRTSLK